MCSINFTRQDLQKLESFLKSFYLTVLPIFKKICLTYVLMLQDFLSHLTVLIIKIYCLT